MVVQIIAASMAKNALLTDFFSMHEVPILPKLHSLLDLTLVKTEMAAGVWYFLERYKEPTILPAGFAMAPNGRVL